MHITELKKAGQRTTALLVLSCALAFFVFGMTSSIIGPTISDVAAVIGVSVAVAGTLRSGRQVGQFLGFLALGKAADNYNLRMLCLFGSLTMTLGLLLVTSQGIVVAICAALVWGVGHSAYNLAPQVIIGRFFEARAPSIMTALQGVYGVGGIFGPWIVELTRERGVYFIYTVSAILVLLAGLIYTLSTSAISENRPVARQTSSHKSKKIGGLQLAPYLLGMLLSSGAVFIASDWLYYHVQNLIGGSSYEAAFATSSFWFSMTAGRFLLSFAIPKVGERFIIRASIVCSVVGSLLLITPSAPVWVVVVSALLLGFGLAAIYPILIMLAANLNPDNRGAVTGYAAAAGALGAVILPAMQGWLTAESGTGMVILLLSTIAMAGSLWFIPFPGEEPRESSQGLSSA